MKVIYEATVRVASFTRNFGGLLKDIQLMGQSSVDRLATLDIESVQDEAADRFLSAFRYREYLRLIVASAAPCEHPAPLSTPGLGCISASTGDERVPRRWCPDCGALEVVVESTQERSWISPKANEK